MRIVNVYRRGAIIPCYEVRGRYLPVREWTCFEFEPFAVAVKVERVR